MTSLLIKDLSLAQRLDREAACSVRGGDSRLADPGIAPGGCVSLPWEMPALPSLPALPDFPTLPGSGWCGTPAPQPLGPRVPISRTPTDPAVLM